MDVMHAHVARDYPVCGVAARLGGTAFLLTRHHFRSFPKSRAYQWAINPASALIAVSGSIANGISTAFPKIADRVVVIPNWVDVERRDYVSREEARHRLGLTRPLTVAVAGQLSPLKQQHVFIEACAQLDKSILAGINVLLAGTAAPGDEPYAEGIKSLVRESGLSETVLMPGFVPDFPKLLAAIDLVVVPSANEGFSLVVIEAMAAGVAVVASSVGGPSEIIDDAVSGVLVPPGDAAALRASMSELLTNHARRLEIGHAGREVARSRFARERVIDRIEALYRQVI
jgi:glycosyltransferase involved in cell wall biosynthesis